MECRFRCQAGKEQEVDRKKAANDSQAANLFPAIVFSPALPVHTHMATDSPSPAAMIDSSDLYAANYASCPCRQPLLPHDARLAQISEQREHWNGCAVKVRHG